MATSDTLASADRAFVNAVDDVVRGAARRAGRHVECRRGCTPCCIGVFDVTALDAARLAVVAAYTVDADADAIEGALPERLHRERGVSGDTVIAAALVLEARATPGRRVRAGRA